MSLLSEAMTPCQFMHKTTQTDPEGGYITTWVEGAQFDAAITYDNSTEGRVAEKAGVTNLYTVTVDKSIALEYHDVFKRLSDGKILRVTSDGEDNQTPARASFAVRQVSAEEYEPR